MMNRIMSWILLAALCAMCLSVAGCSGGGGDAEKGQAVKVGDFEGVPGAKKEDTYPPPGADGAGDQPDAAHFSAFRARC